LILAAPVRAILALLGDASRLPEPLRPVVVLDLGSTKRAIAAAMQALPPPYDPVGGHPMCGKEVSGLAHAEAGLFRDRVFVLTPLARTSRAALRLARAVVETAGARPMRLTPERHDDLAALASHLPYAAAALLVRAAQAAGDDEVWAMAASGFRDTSRLAASDVDMMLDILLTNREPLLRALDRYQRELSGLIRLLQAGDADELRALLEAVRAGRRAHFP
jgi:prephenate dehydrogenase